VSYPILIKAAAGGGGRGMRVVAEASQLETALEAAAREASAAFGDGRIFIEKYLAHPRTSKYKFLATITATWSRSASVIAQSSGVIRRLSRNRRPRDFPPGCARK